MTYFSETFGLVTRHDSTSENSGLFFAYYLILKVILNKEISKEDSRIFFSKMENARVENGLYLRSAHHKTRTVSHDEQTGFLVSSKILKTNHGDEIMSYLESHFGNYPATGSSKFYQPSNYYAWGLLTGRRWTGIFFPLYLTSMMISIGKPKQQTSSKLIYLAELYLIKDEALFTKMLWKLFVTNMKNQYGKYWIKALFEIYFNTEGDDFPLLELARRIDHDKLDF